MVKLLSTVIYIAVLIEPSESLNPISVPTDMLAMSGVGVLFILLILSAFFSSAEIAMFSLAQHRLRTLAEDGIDGAVIAAELKEDPHRLLVTILVGNNLVNIAMSSVATGLFGLYLGRGQAVLAATLGITAVVLLFGESAPKSYAIENTESWVLTVARPLKFSEYALYPLVVTFDRLTRAVNRVTGGGSAIETSYVTREEIQEMIQTGENEGVIDAEEREMLRRVFRFSETITKEIMTPRLDVTALPRTASVDDAIAVCVESGHTRLPVFENNLDTIIGAVELETLVDTEVDGGSSLESHVSETIHVPESKHVDKLFQEMREKRVEQVVVVDEFGTTEGIVTIEDIVEAVVGEILDEQEDNPIQIIDEQTVIVDGSVMIETVNDIVAVEFPEGEEFETIAGFVFNRAGRLVESGETFDYEGVEITIEEIDNSRIERVCIVEPESSTSNKRPEVVSG